MIEHCVKLQRLWVKTHTEMYRIHALYKSICVNVQYVVNHFTLRQQTQDKMKKSCKNNEMFLVCCLWWMWWFLVDFDFILLILAGSSTVSVFKTQPVSVWLAVHSDWLSVLLITQHLFVDCDGVLDSFLTYQTFSPVLLLILSRQTFSPWHHCSAFKTIHTYFKNTWWAINSRITAKGLL